MEDRRKSKNILFDSVVKGIPFFVCFSGMDREELRELLVEKHFSKNNIIFLEEDTQSYMYVVLSGSVKVVHMSADGKERILAVHKAGDFFGEMAMLDGKTAPATVIAMEDTHILILSRKDFEKCLMRSTTAMKEIISVLCTRLRESWMMIKVLSLPSAEERITTVLQMMGRQYGVKDDRGTIIAMKLTHQDIADYASVSRETVTRYLNKLTRDGKIMVLEDRNLLLVGKGRRLDDKKLVLNSSFE